MAYLQRYLGGSIKTTHCVGTTIDLKELKNVISRKNKKEFVSLQKEKRFVSLLDKFYIVQINSKDIRKFDE